MYGFSYIMLVDILNMIPASFSNWRKVSQGSMETSSKHTLVAIAPQEQKDFSAYLAS